MRVILVTWNTPTQENVRGASALPYHLLTERKDDVSVTVYSFNANKLSATEIADVEKHLQLQVSVVEMPRWYNWMTKMHLLFLRIFLPLPYLCYIRMTGNDARSIRENQPDLLWIYGEELLGVVEQFKDLKRVHLGPDTESLYYYRMIGRRFVMNNALNYWKCALMYRKYARMEREFPSDRYYTYLAVGEEDVQHLQQLNPNVNARFIRHPHYEVNSQFIIHNSQFHHPKIKLLVAGQYNLYMQQEADLLNAQFIIHNAQFKGAYSITFLGKGWEKHVESLKEVGYEVYHIKFAPDYIEEICKHDIQLTPIAIGTGTKGKVLDALANGLLVIGTPYALENIAVEHGVSCLEYSSANEVIAWLTDTPNNRKRYERMAEMGREAVLKHHGRKQVSRQLFGLANS